MLRRLFRHFFPVRVVRIPDKTRLVCFSKDGKKYLKVFNTQSGANICFQIESVDYENSDLRDEYHPETMFTDIESNQCVTIF